MSLHPVYLAWQRMRTRCTNAKSKDYQFYGGRGIRICERWTDPANFIEDMLPTWRRGLTLEREDFNGDYGPGNCSWATMREQSRNTRRTVFVDTPWGRLCAKDAAKLSGLNYDLILRRAHAGCSQERMFAPP